MMLCNVIGTNILEWNGISKFKYYLQWSAIPEYNKKNVPWHTRKAQTALVSSGQLNCCSPNFQQCVVEPLLDSTGFGQQSSYLCALNAVLMVWMKVTVLFHMACLVSRGHLKYTYKYSTITEPSFSTWEFMDSLYLNCMKQCIIWRDQHSVFSL